MDPRLSSAIATPAIRDAACELVRLAHVALADLRKLDDSLYSRFVASRELKQQPAEVAEGLRTVWDETFGSLDHLLAYSGKVTASEKAKAEAAPASDDLDFGFEQPAEEKSFELELGDIGELVAGLDDPEQDESARWAKALESISGIEYGLETTYRDALQRLDVALAAGEVTSVLGLLDETTSSTNEAIHALVSAVYTAFVSDADTATVVPEYLTTLKRALKVRRGIAQLSAVLHPYNDTLQADAPAARARHPDALIAIRDELHDFVGSDIWRAMRAADRWELAQFDQQLQDQPLAAARLTAEGLVKYLESLGAINQREVLVQHDERVLEELREVITNARALNDLSPSTTHELLLKACQTSLELRGRRPTLEPLLDQNAQLGASTPAQNEALIKRLEAVIAAAG